MILSWLCYLLCSYILIEVFVNSRPIEIGIEIVSEQNQEVTISYNVFPAQAGAVSYRRQLKKGTNFISTPFLEDLEIRRLYLLSSAPINFSIHSFGLIHTVNEVEISIDQLSENCLILSNNGQESTSLQGSKSKVDVELTETASVLMIDTEIMSQIYTKLSGIFYTISLVLALVCLILTLGFLRNSSPISSSVVYVMCFIAIIYTPFLSQKDNHTTENRVLEPFPDLNVNIWRIPNSYNKYYNDHFPFRNELRNVGNFIKYNIFKTSPKPDLVQIGKDGWLFFSSKQIRSVYQGTHIYTDEQLEKIRIGLESKAALLAKHDISYYFVMPPLKHQVYSEYLPDGFTIVSQVTKRSQLMAYLKANSSINLIDPYQKLMELKSEGEVYYKTDTHWNRKGAFAVYQMIINKVREDYPTISPPLMINDFEIERRVDYEGDLVSLLNMKNTFSREPFFLKPKFKSNYNGQRIGEKMQGETSFIFYETNLKDQPRMLLYRDSFAEYLHPYLAEHFSRTGVSWSRQLNDKRILQEKPDIIIHEMMERFIDDLLVE